MRFNKCVGRITHRAYDILLNNGGLFGHDLDHWFAAERGELAWKVCIEFREEHLLFRRSLSTCCSIMATERAARCAE